MVSVLSIKDPEPGYASVESTYSWRSEAPIFLTRPVRYIAVELNACLALVFLLRFTNFVNMIFGGFI